MEDFHPHPTTLSDRIYHILKKQILQHTLPPGTRLVDYQIAQQLGVSRTPVREAIYHLVRSGFVENSDKRGFYVLSASHQDIDEWYEVRQIIDEAVVSRLIRPATAQMGKYYHQQLLQLERQYLQEYESHPHQFSVVDEHFHSHMVAILDNQRIAHFYASTAHPLRAFRYSNDSSPAWRDCFHQTHLLLLRRIHERDLPGALQLVRQHVGSARKKSHTWLDDLTSSS